MNCRKFIPLAVMICGMLGTSTAKATSISFNGLTTLSGTGIGSQNTIMTVQANGSEWGSVSWNGATDVIAGDAGTGASQTQTIPISALTGLGINSSNLGVFLQVNQN